MKVVLEEASYQRCGRVEFLLLLLKSQRMTRKTKPKTETMKRPVQSRSPRVPAGEREREREAMRSPHRVPRPTAPPPLPPSLSVFTQQDIYKAPEQWSCAAFSFLCFSVWPSFQKQFEEQKLAATEQASLHWRANVRSLLPIRNKNTESQNNQSLSTQTLFCLTLKEAAFSSAFLSTTTLASLFFFFSDFGLPS